METQPVRATSDDAPFSTAKSSSDDDRLMSQAVTINRSPGDLFQFWRHLPNLASFMENVEQIELLDEQRSRWVVKGPGDSDVEWVSRITDEREGEMLAWESEAGADVPNSGTVTFRDAGARGAVVTATIAYDPPAGTIGRIIAKMFQREPAIQARRDLRRFKQLMETGEIATGARNRRLLQEGKN